MNTGEKTSITISTTVNAPVKTVWDYFSNPDHITKWNFASDDWHSPKAENDLRAGGKFSSRMEAKDGSFGFDFSGVYDEVKPHELIAYTLEDGRKVNVSFEESGSGTTIVETFESETTHSYEMQRDGWQAILNNFKKYVEASEK
ncbi:MAG: SRPBCC domain-containing protein [Flavisolibacter sp.]|jgi:uncharacterized protein YndB with AHSA1/START domain|nr:SRPBCC domain-containing protein [Flavisolibacter sp.]